jgi:iron complex transport system substrate-binding protein
MRRRVVGWWQFVLFVCCVLNATSHAAIRVQDGMERPVVLESTAQRIVSLSPHITENLFAIGAGDALVGVSDYSDYPEAAKALPRISGFSGLDLERILALKPDLVVAWHSGNPREQVERLAELGMHVFFSEPGSLDELAEELIALGRLTGHEQRAGRRVSEFREAFKALDMKYHHRVRRKVFFQIWREPLMTIADDHIITDIIELCGGENIFSDLTASSAGVVDKEAVIGRRPDVMLASLPTHMEPVLLDQWREWPQIPAVQHDHLYYINSDVINRHSLRLVEGATLLCESLDKSRDD